MSRLNFDHLSSFFSVELVTSATWPARIEGGPSGAFNWHLEQAWQAVDATAHTTRPPTPDPRTGADDRGVAGPDSPAAPYDGVSQDTRPSSTEEDPATSTEARSDHGQETTASENQPEAEQGTVDSEDQRRSSEKDSPGDDVSEANAAQVTAAQLAAASTSRQIADELQGPDQAAAPTRAKNRLAPGGQLLPDGSEESGPTDAEIITDEDAADGPQAKMVDPTQKANGPKDQLTEQLTQATEAGKESGEGASDGAATSGSQPSDGSAQAQRSASEVRRPSQRQGTKDLTAGSAGDHPLAGQSRSAEPTPAEPKPGMDPNASSPTGIKAEVAQPTANTASVGDGEGDTPALARGLPNQGSREASAARPQEPSGPQQADRVRFVQRVARAFEAVGERGGTVRLRLHPPELGSLRLDVTVRNGTMNARLEVETPGARNMLLDHLPALRDRLAEQDIKVGRFDVDLTDQSPGGSPQRPGDHPQPHDHPGDNAPRTGTDQEAETERPPQQPTAVAQSGEGDRLDVII